MYGLTLCAERNDIFLMEIHDRVLEMIDEWYGEREVPGILRYCESRERDGCLCSF